MSGRKTSLFKSGRVLATPGALEVLDEAESQMMLARHLMGDWGSVCAEDKAANFEALETGGRLLSAYETSKGTKIWIITEADRSSTTLLLPEEY